MATNGSLTKLLVSPTFLDTVWMGTNFGSPRPAWARPCLLFANSWAKPGHGNRPPKNWQPNLARAVHRGIKGSARFSHVFPPLSPFSIVSAHTQEQEESSHDLQSADFAQILCQSEQLRWPPALLQVPAPLGSPFLYGRFTSILDLLVEMG
jgi:hypothetical protein